MSTAIDMGWRQQIPARARFVVLDDHPLYAEAVTARLRSLLRFSEIAYSGASLSEGQLAARATGCDCAIVDLDLGGPATASEIVSAFSMHGIAVVALADQASAEGCEAAFIAGARAYVAKRSDPADLGSAVHAVLEGRTWAAREFTERRQRSSLVSLSAQERRSLVLYASGMTQQMVAHRMGIAPSTVKHYLDRVRQKYAEAGKAARTKLELHAIARGEGLLP